MPVIVAKPRIDGKSDYYDDRDLISVSLSRLTMALSLVGPPRVPPNPLVNRTRNGMPRLGLISFWPKRVLPLRAGYRERSASQAHALPSLALCG